MKKGIIFKENGKFTVNIINKQNVHLHGKDVYSLDNKCLCKNSTTFKAFDSFITFFKIYKEFMLVTLESNILYLYKKGVEKLWSVSGDVVVDALIFNNYKFLLLSKDGFIRFYVKDLIIGEFKVESSINDVKLTSLIDDWNFITCTNRALRKYDRNRKIWELNLSRVKIVKYEPRLNVIFVLVENSVMCIDSQTGKVLKEFKNVCNLPILDLEFDFENGQILILLWDGILKEISFTLRANSLECDNVNLAVSKEISLKEIQTKKVKEEIVAEKETADLVAEKETPDLITADLSLDTEFNLNLRIFSLEKKKLKKILVESCLLKESLFFIEKGIVDFKTSLEIQRFKSGIIFSTLGYDSGKITLKKLNVKKFNNCLYDSGLKLPGLVTTKSIGDFDMYSWIKSNFLSLPREKTTLLGWRFKDGSTFFLEVLSTKIKIYGSNSREFISKFLRELKKDYPLLQVKALEEEFIDLVSLVSRGQNALECRQWEEFLLITRAKRELLKKIL